MTSKKCTCCKTMKKVEDYKKGNTQKLYKTCIRCRDRQKRYRTLRKLEQKTGVQTILKVEDKQTYELKYIIKKQLICKEIIKSYEKKRSLNYIEEEMAREKKVVSFVKKWSRVNGLEEVKQNYKYEFKMKNKVYNFNNRFHGDITRQFNMYNKTPLSSFVVMLIVELKDRKFKTNDLKKLMKGNMIQDILYAVSNNHATIRRNCTKINNTIKKKFGNVDKNLLVFLRLPDAIEINKQAEKKAEKNNQETIQLSSQNILKLVNNIKNSTSWNDMVITTGLTTGARLIEILNPKVSQFTQESKYMIKQSGVAKDKSGSPTNPIKPSLFNTSEKTIQLINNIREQIPRETLELSNEKITEKYNKSLNNRLRKITKDVLNFSEDRTIHFHDLRKIYANVAYETYGKNETKQSYMGYVKSILGHHTLSSVKNYSSIKIKEEKQEKKQEKKTTIQDMRTAEFMNTNERGAKAKQERIEKIGRLMKQLEIMGIKPTNKLVSSFGYGSRTLTAYKKSIHKS